MRAFTTRNFADVVVFELAKKLSSAVGHWFGLVLLPPGGRRPIFGVVPLSRTNGRRLSSFAQFNNLFQDCFMLGIAGAHSAINQEKHENQQPQREEHEMPPVAPVSLLGRSVEIAQVVHLP